MEWLRSILQLVYMAILKMEYTKRDSHKERRDSEIELGVHVRKRVAHEAWEACHVKVNTEVENRDQATPHSYQNEKDSKHSSREFVINVTE
jgi:hypothetical protein